MRSFIPVIYNITLTVAKDEPRPSMLTIFKGRPSVVKVDIKRHLMSELPESNDGIGQWCRDMFVSKDAFLDKYFCTGTFGSQEIQEIGRPIKSLIVMIVWSCLLTGAAVGVVLWTRLFCTWQGLVITLAVLFVVTIIMQILILFSQSEPDMDSMPIKILPQDPMKEILLKR
uniref:1-acylglycerol-3-phosphate O-acyltransferase n=1 Tax=Opuntia streptacantha TaxID=393608 RepID=A0A7C9AR31_OPUST